MPSPRSRSCTRSRFRIAVLLLALMGVALAAILVSCPQGKPPNGHRTATTSPTAAAGAGPPAGPATGADAVPAGGEAERGEAADDGETTPEPAGPSGEAVARGRIAIVIDDAGYDLDDLQPFLELPVPLAVAVLPNASHSAEAARRVAAAGKELLLHLPMEPEGGEDPGPDALHASTTPAELEALLERALAAVPGAVGVNNHMGSRATADPACMAALLEALDRRGLFFLDSRTTTRTVAAAEAQRLGVPYLERTVFLDAVDGDVERSLEAAVAAAAGGGSVVAIGHVQTAGLADAVRRALDAMAKAKVRPSTVSSLLVADAGGRAE